MTTFLVVLILECTTDPKVYGPYYAEQSATVFAQCELAKVGYGKAFVLEENSCPGRKRFDIISRSERVKES